MAPARSRAPSSSKPSRVGQKSSGAGRPRPGGSAAAQREERNQRLVAERVAAGRAAQPPRDPTGEYHARLRELADLHHLEVGDLLDEFDERAAVREYCGEADRATAERLACADVQERLEPQRSLIP